MFSSELEFCDFCINALKNAVNRESGGIVLIEQDPMNFLL